MTPEELDRVRADEAKRRASGNGAYPAQSSDMLCYYRELVRTNWTPPPAVPADLLRAREIVAGVCNGRECPEMAQAYISGGCDKSYTLEATRIALHDPTFVIPTEVDDEMWATFINAWRSGGVRGGLHAYNALLRDRAAKNMEVLG